MDDRIRTFRLTWIIEIPFGPSTPRTFDPGEGVEGRRQIHPRNPSSTAGNRPSLLDPLPGRFQPPELFDDPFRLLPGIPDLPPDIDDEHLPFLRSLRREVQPASPCRPTRRPRGGETPDRPQSYPASPKSFLGESSSISAGMVICRTVGGTRPPIGSPSAGREPGGRDGTLDDPEGSTPGSFGRYRFNRHGILAGLQRRRIDLERPRVVRCPLPDQHAS